MNPKFNVGRKLHEIRKQKHHSLRSLADRCDLTANAIGKIERGEVSPTINSLEILAQALGIDILEFFFQNTEKDVVLTRSSTLMEISEQNLKTQNLGQGLKNQVLEPYQLTILPHTTLSEGSVSEYGEVFMRCLSGAVELFVHGENFSLAAGDNLLFKSFTPYTLRNSSDRPAILLIVFQAPLGSHYGLRHIS